VTSSPPFSRLQYNFQRFLSSNSDILINVRHLPCKIKFSITVGCPRPCPSHHSRFSATNSDSELDQSTERAWHTKTCRPSRPGFDIYIPFVTALPTSSRYYRTLQRPSSKPPDLPSSVPHSGPLGRSCSTLWRCSAHRTHIFPPTRTPDDATRQHIFPDPCQWRGESETHTGVHFLGVKQVPGAVPLSHRTNGRD
jgi:hypothetical protein